MKMEEISNEKAEEEEQAGRKEIKWRKVRGGECRGGRYEGRKEGMADGCGHDCNRNI